MHDCSIKHQDLKPLNILLNEDLTLKIIDFGFARIIKETIKTEKETIGTPHYMAPEQFRNVLTLSSDIWSMGCIILQLFTGLIPYHNCESYSVHFA